MKFNIERSEKFFRLFTFIIIGCTVLFIFYQVVETTKVVRERIARKQAEKASYLEEVGQLESKLAIRRLPSHPYTGKTNPLGLYIDSFTLIDEE